MENAYKINGGKPARGTITCFGAKNFATKAIVASILSSEKTVLTNVPNIGDIDITLDMISSIGVTYNYDKQKNILEIDPSNIKSSDIEMPDSGSNRIPILLLSPLLHRLKKAEVPTVEGCNIGARKVDYHIQAMQDFGAIIKEENGRYIASAPNGLNAHSVHLPYPSVGATETALYLSVLANGTSTIENIAIEPEIMELITMLRSMGAIIYNYPNRKIVVHGVSKLKGTRIEILGDRIEAASFACLACATNGEIIVKGVRPETLGNFLSYYRSIGGGFELLDRDVIKFYRQSELKAAMIQTDVYPGFSTDWQQPFTILLTQAKGVSVVHETVYEKRFGYLKVLNELGANTQLSTYCLGETCRFNHKNFEHSAIVTGPTKLRGGNLVIPDLRAGLAYIIAAALADGESTISGVKFVERGYGDIVSRLSGIIDIKKV